MSEPSSVYGAAACQSTPPKEFHSLASLDQFGIDITSLKPLAAIFAVKVLLVRSLSVYDILAGSFFRLPLSTRCSLETVPFPGRDVDGTVFFEPTTQPLLLNFYSPVHRRRTEATCSFSCFSRSGSGSSVLTYHWSSTKQNIFICQKQVLPPQTLPVVLCRTPCIFGVWVP